MFSITPSGGGGGTPGNSWWVCAAQVLTLSHTKKCHFSHLFSDQTSKIHAHFQTCPFRQKLCYHYLA